VVRPPAIGRNIFHHKASGVFMPCLIMREHHVQQFEAESESKRQRVLTNIAKAIQTDGGLLFYECVSSLDSDGYGEQLLCILETFRANPELLEPTSKLCEAFSEAFFDGLSNASRRKAVAQ
jgi:hypothetical protein